MEDNTDSPPANNSSISAKCNIKNILIGLNCIKQMTSEAVKAQLSKKRWSNMRSTRESVLL